jgi:hypothetical protein
MRNRRSPGLPATPRARPVPAAALAAALLAASGGAGCPSFDPVPDRTRWYTLPGPEAAEPARPDAAARPPTLGLGPVSLPPYLDRPEVVRRVSAERIAVSGQDRWASPLPEQFRRTLAEQLRARLPGWKVVEWPWPALGPPDAVAEVDVLRFEADAGGGGTLEARWTVRGGAGAPAAGATRISESAAPGDAAASVAALGRAVEALARDLAAQARRQAGR